MPKHSAAGGPSLERGVEERRAEEDSDAYKPRRRGWCLGGQEFRKELLAEMAGSMGQEHDGEERWESEVERAERIVADGLRRARWEEAQLGSRPKGHRVKVRVALRLRGETMVTHPWIAERLRMGSRSHASNLVYAKQKRQK